MQKMFRMIMRLDFSRGMLFAVSAVHDGYVLNNSVVQSPVGGQLLTEALRHNLIGKGAKLQPWYMYRASTGSSAGDGKRTGAVSASAATWATDFVTADIKESLCRVNEVPFIEEENLNMPVQSYELPDGSSVDIGVERFRIPEILFNSVCV
jgi:actin-like protein 6A